MSANIGEQRRSRLLDYRAVGDLLGGRGRTSIANDVRAGFLPSPIRISAGRGVGRWLWDEVQRVVEARIAGRSDDEILELVRQIVAERAVAKLGKGGAIGGCVRADDVERQGVAEAHGLGPDRKRVPDLLRGDEEAARGARGDDE